MCADDRVGPQTWHFLVAEMAGAGDGGSALEVHLPGGAVARVVHPEGIKLLAELLRHLA